ncbi:MAG: helix-turn-helix domain-containing protein [Chloroflexota bacterium]
MLTTRLRILEYFRKHHSASALELSRILGMTPANIRHHLGILESNDLVDVLSKKTGRRGRPENIYGLSRRSLGDSLDRLSVSMFMEWIRKLSRRDLEQALKSLANRMVGEGDSLRDPVLPPARRLTTLINRLNTLHYRARWEAGAAGPRIILNHCPYLAVIHECPELCDIDGLMIEIALGEQVKQRGKLEPGSRGETQCTFMVGGESKQT